MAETAGPAPEIKAAADALRAGRLEDAAQRIEALLGAEPDNADALNLKVALLTARKQFQAALPLAERASALRPDDPRLALNLAAMLVNTGAPERALSVFDRVLAARPNDLRALHDRGRTLIEVGRPEAAKRDLERVAEMAPMLPEPKLSLAEAQMETGDAEGAMRTLQAADQFGDRTARRDGVFGRAAAALGQWDKAADAFEGAVRHDPDQLSAYAQLADVERCRGNFDKARAATDRLLERAPMGRRGEADAALTVLSLERLGPARILAEPRPWLVPHAGSNFIAQLPTEQIAYAHAFADHPASRAAAEAALGTCGLIFNNWANAEAAEASAPGDRTALEQLLAHPDAPPTINPPAAAAETSRAANAAAYAQAEGFVFPATALIPAHRANGSEGALSVADRAARAVEAVGLPMILRPLDTQRGGGARRVDNEAALKGALGAFEGQAVYAIAYHDCGREDGIFRRYRLTVVEGRVWAANLLAAKGWSVHGVDQSDFDWDETGLSAEQAAFLAEPESLLGAAPETVFAPVLARCPLDVYGIDFGIRTDGRPVAFEVNAAMMFNSLKLVRKLPQLGPRRAEIMDAIEALFLRRARAV